MNIVEIQTQNTVIYNTSTAPTKFILPASQFKHFSRDTVPLNYPPLPLKKYGKKVNDWWLVYFMEGSKYWYNGWCAIFHLLLNSSTFTTKEKNK